MAATGTTGDTPITITTMDVARTTTTTAMKVIMMTGIKEVAVATVTAAKRAVDAGNSVFVSFCLLDTDTARRTSEMG